MASATLNLRVSPRRMLSAREAADYCGMPINKFPMHCAVSPIELPSGKKMFDIHDLDNWIDGMKVGQPNGDDDIIGRL